MFEGDQGKELRFHQQREVDIAMRTMIISIIMTGININREMPHGRGYRRRKIWNPPLSKKIIGDPSPEPIQTPIQIRVPNPVRFI